VNTFSSSFTPP